MTRLAPQLFLILVMTMHTKTTSAHCHHTPGGYMEKGTGRYKAAAVRRS